MNYEEKKLPSPAHYADIALNHIFTISFIPHTYKVLVAYGICSYLVRPELFSPAIGAEKPDLPVEALYAGCASVFYCAFDGVMTERDNIARFVSMLRYKLM